MPTNLAIDDKLLTAAVRVGGHKTKKAAVTQALREYIQRREQLGVLRLFGTVDVDPAYDSTAQRRRK
ncbi:MAG TPA: type II toxin-antitoxin system VapB family antitoxin [Kofleriaceae bacterium]|jgi:Arc/MetJ family transcription regulator|nr:type II toxin-antitoxin system VapB family antitoxin [Kofleriaceae bacterium]